jgi:hypothetical protein
MALIGILLAEPREGERVLRYAEAAQKLGHEVHVFLTFTGVELLTEPLAASLAACARLTACAQSAQQRNVRIPPFVTAGSQFDHAQLASRADRFLAFTPLAP